MTFQSTLPRREWLDDFFANVYPLGISIHTPAKGVTKNINTGATGPTISIHTPAKGVTNIFDKRRFFGNYFNPHSREGSDRYEGLSSRRRGKFQSTLPRREWRLFICIYSSQSRFQSTLPRREWLSPYTLTVLTNLYFNPHSREGSDVKKEPDKKAKLISIHTPAKGVTTRDYIDTERLTISIHTPAKGVTTWQKTLKMKL